MRIKQIRVSRNVKFFADRMKQKFDLVDYDDADAPVVMYGMYNADDYDFYEQHDPYIIVLWRGTDAKILNAKKATRVLSKTNVRHIAGTAVVQNTLRKYGIKSEVMAVTPTPLDINCARSGNAVYCYICSDVKSMSDKYKLVWLRKLAAKMPYKFIFTRQKQYAREDLINIYKRCFVGVRLLDHDGMSNTIIEMGMMGRRTISNSPLPHTIRWKSFEGVKKAIEREYKARNRDNEKISRDYWDLVDIGNAWLELE